MPLAALVAPGGPWLWRHLSPCPLWSHSRLLCVHVSLCGHSVGFGSTRPHLKLVTSAKTLSPKVAVTALGLSTAAYPLR